MNREELIRLMVRDIEMSKRIIAQNVKAVEVLERVNDLKEGTLADETRKSLLESARQDLKMRQDEVREMERKLAELGRSI